MMRQSIGYTCRLLQAKKVAHGGNIVQEVRESMSRGMKVNLKVQQGLTTSCCDGGNPPSPTEESQPGYVKTNQNVKDPPSGGPEKAQDMAFQKEYCTLDFFHDKAREVEERLAKESKVPETQDTKK